jgi:hypothetical protein
MALLWKFLEFFVRDINHSSATLPFPETSTQIILKILKSVHWVNSQVNNEKGDLSFTLSRKLALVLETTGDHEGAYQILKVIDCCICSMRQKLGENGSLSDSMTSLVAHLTTSYAAEKNQAALSELACIHIDVLTAKYRCHIKEQYQSTMQNLRDRMDQHFRLTKKQIILLPDFRVSDVDHNIKDLCGDNAAKQLLYCLVFARQANHYPLEARKTCVKNAYCKLSEAMVSKCSSARISRGGSGGANRKIGFKVQFKNSDSISIQAIVPDSEKDQHLYFRVFCRRKSLNDSVSITNTQFLGTGKRNSRLVVFILTA